MIDGPSLARIERLVWILAGVVLALGYFLVTARYEHRIAQSSLRSQDYYRRMLLNQRLVANSAKVRTLREELRVRLDGVLIDTPLSEMTAVLVRDIDALARADRATLLSIVPQRLTTPSSGKTIPARPAAGLQNIAVDIMVRGRYPDILRIVARLPRLHTLLRVSDVQFTLSGGQKPDASSPVLEAKIHTLIYRYVGSRTKGDT